MMNKIKDKQEPKNPNQYFYFSGIRFHNVTMDEAVSTLEGMVHKKEKGFVITSNAQHISFLHNDRDMQKLFNKASLLVADGMSIVWASRLLGKPLKERCSGPDLFKKIFETFGPKGIRFFLLGGRNGSEKIAEAKLLKEYPKIKISTYSPPFGFENSRSETTRIIRKINDFKTDILILFVGSPKSEKWIADHFPRLNITLGFSLGAALSFYTGTEERAPRWIQNAGFEWLFRFYQQPERLWKRYLLGNIKFIFILAKELINRKFRQ